MIDPYLYPGTRTLINKLGIRDTAALQAFETEITAQRMSEGFLGIALTSEGYCRLHRHLFQDVYDWAGKIRTVDIAKGHHLFCLAQYVEAQMRKRFDAIAHENWGGGLSSAEFAERAAVHVSELNAIHPFREGNGRVMRAFLKALGVESGHRLNIARIRPKQWIDASMESMHSGNTTGFRRVIVEMIEDDRQRRSALREIGSRDMA